MIKAFIFGEDSKHFSIIKRMGTFLQQEVQIIDLRSYDPEIFPNDVLFVFGKKAGHYIQNVSNIKVEFPELDKLDAINGDSQLRQHAWHLLNKTKKLIDHQDKHSEQEEKQLDVTELQEVVLDEIPKELTINNLQVLEAHIKEKGIDCWYGTTVSGKKIKVSLKPDPDPEIDMNITFSELFAVLSLKELFQIKKLNIVYS